MIEREKLNVKPLRHNYMKNKKETSNLLSTHKRLWMAILISFISSAGLFAQSVSVSGNVIDDQGEPLIGLIVTEQGNTKNNTICDIDGNFTLNTKIGAVLEFKQLGLKTQFITVNSNNFLNVVLEQDNQTLDDLVVIGYGSIKKKDLTGAVSIIDTKALKDRVSTADIGSTLKGLASGVKVTTSGLAGDGAVIRIRGIGTLTNNDPLYVIDGVVGGSDTFINMQDVESIQVLKDASSAAIYGSRAANGVIIVTTKQGGDGPMKVDFSSNLTLSWLPRYDLLGRDEYIKYNDMAYMNAYNQGIEMNYLKQDHLDGNTDWQDQMLQTGILQNYNVSLAGGGKPGKYYVSLNYMDDSGTMYGTGYKRYTARVNTSGQKGIFSFGETLNFASTKKELMNGNHFSSFVSMPPTIPVFDDNNIGGYGYGVDRRATNFAHNPVAKEDLFNQRNNETFVNGSIYGQVTLLDMLSAKYSLAYDYYDGKTNTLRKEGGWVMGQGADVPYITIDNFKSRKFILEQLYTFKKKFGAHDIDALFGITYESWKGQQHYTTALEPLIHNGKYFESLDAATGTKTSGSSVNRTALISYLGRLNYSYANKYLFSATFRRDGTSQFAKGNRWDIFPSGSLGWRISEEKFFNIPLINDLKIRTNYGTLGNSSVGAYDYLSVINLFPRAILSDGKSDYVAVGATQSKLANYDIKWEKTTQMNAGFDLTMLDNRLSVSAELFTSKTENILVALEIPLTSGNAGGNPYVNAASMKNSGVEFDVKWRETKKDFNYSVGVNLSHVKNKLVDLGSGESSVLQDLTYSQIGRPLAMWNLYKQIGIFQSYEEILNYKSSEGKVIQPNAHPGDIKYQDANDDGTINASDRQIVGSPWPKLEAGLTLSAGYKNFDIQINGYGRFGYDIWNGSRYAAGDFQGNQNNFKGLNPWTPTNTNTNQPHIVANYSANSVAFQDRWLEDGSFFRISEIALGYNIPQTLCKKIDVDHARFGVSFNNMITFTKYSGLDPEFKQPGIYTIAADNCEYPNPRSVLFSLSLGF